MEEELTIAGNADGTELSKRPFKKRGVTHLYIGDTGVAVIMHGSGEYEVLLTTGASVGRKKTLCMGNIHTHKPSTIKGIIEEESKRLGG